ncbi:MAG: LacI family DNA-binding transcriptional regulator [Firmicutes bacterium]|nr:LacI family DNA-binding transcriptional regulator [Bacillota bacterium]
MKNKVSMNDIADALNISRNTVSKAFNNQYLPDKTKQLILNKAIEMGYKNLDIVSRRETVLHYKNILILTSNDIQNLNFFLSVLRGIDNIVTKYNLNLLQYKFDSPEKIKELEQFIHAQKISGILALETFNSEIVKEILSLKIPSVFLDSTVNFIEQNGDYDIVLMENRNNVKHMVRNIIKSSRISKIGFVGDFNHCLSFYERFLGFKEALFESRIHYTSRYNITKPDEFPYGNIDELEKELRLLEELPELFVCANDFLAISIIRALKRLNKRVPQDIQVIGFDNTIDARNFEVPLTTIDTDKEVLGNESIVTLLNRIKYKEDRNRIIYLKTTPIYRQSTKM